MAFLASNNNTPAFAELNRIYFLFYSLFNHFLMARSSFFEYGRSLIFSRIIPSLRLIL